MNRSVISVMLGSIPPKLLYWTCQGSVAVRIVALPLSQTAVVPVLVPTFALVTCPIRRLAVFVMVALWKVPSSVTGQVTGAPIVGANVRSVAFGSVLSQVILKLVPERESLVAEAVLTAAPRSRVAARQLSTSLLRVSMWTLSLVLTLV